MHDQQPPATSQEVPTWHGHVVLCGLGTAGVRIAEGLMRAGARVVVIDNGPSTPFRRAVARHSVEIVEGDCTQPETLRLAGVGQAAAVLVAINDDMVTLRTALMARELNAGARIVIRLFNQRMALHLQDLPVGITALSLSAAAAPTFVLAARCAALRGAFTISNELWALGRLTAPSDPQGEHPLDHWRLAGMVVVACTSPDGVSTLCPPPTYVPPPGSRLLVIARPARLQAVAEEHGLLVSALRHPVSGVEPAPEGRQASVPDRSGRHTRRLWHNVPLLWQHANLVLRWTVVLLLVLLAVSVLVFHLFLSLRLVDALYFTVTLVTTVGLGDINLQHAAAPLKLFGIFVMLAGATLMAMVYALIAGFLLDARIGELLGPGAESARDHYVVAGLGTLGFRVVNALLAAGEQVVAIESSTDSRFLPQLRSLGVPLVAGDATLEETLRRANFGQARALIAATGNDLANIEAVLNARVLQPDLHVVLRVFDPEMAVQARQSFALPASFSAALVGAPLFVSAALGREAPQVLRLPMDRAPGRDPLEEHHGAAELTLLPLQCPVGDALCGRAIGEIAAEHGGIVLLYQHAGTPRLAPSGDGCMQPGDTLVLAIPGGHPVNLLAHNGLVRP